MALTTPGPERARHRLTDTTPLPTGEHKRAAVREMFDRIAPRYDAMNRLLSMGLDQRWRRVALEAVGVRHGDRVLDLACGTGDLCELASARGAHVLGLDFSAEMLAGAGRRGAARWLAQADVARLPIPDGWATVVCCGFALRNFADLESAFREMARVLAPGGRIALLDVDRPEKEWLQSAHSFYFDRVVPRIGGWLSDRAAYAYLPRSTQYLPPRSELLARLAAMGFETVQGRSLMFGPAQLLTAVRRSGA